MSKKTLVQIDGSNFYNKVKQLSPKSHLTTFDYSKFVQLITKVKLKDLHIIYYVGEIRKYPGNKKSQTLYSNQQSLFSNLRKQGIEIKLGYLLFSGGVYHEKGVDVQIAVDMVRGAIKNEFDKCYLFSSDTDLLPAIKTAKEEQKKIIYVGFENFISQALSKNCSVFKVVTKRDILSVSK